MKLLKASSKNDITAILRGGSVRSWLTRYSIEKSLAIYGAIKLLFGNTRNNYDENIHRHLHRRLFSEHNQFLLHFQQDLARLHPASALFNKFWNHTWPRPHVEFKQYHAKHRSISVLSLEARPFNIS